MNVLIACEESQTVCTAFRMKGHTAFSCDIQECSGGHPEWHIKGDVIPILNSKGEDIEFVTEDGRSHIVDYWDLIIAHPPCTDLAVSGAKHFEKKRQDGRQLESIKFFKQFIDCDCEKVCVENPVGIIGGDYIKQWFPAYSGIQKCTQVIQPYEYGHHARKTTCLWLKGLPELVPTNIVEPELVTYTCRNGKKVTFSKDYGAGGGDNGKRRSKTYEGIAQAMADQWG